MPPLDALVSLCRRPTTGWALVVLFAAFVPPVRAQILFTVTDLGTLGGTQSIASDINNSGQIVGNSAVSSGINHAFTYANGVMTDLGTLGGTQSYAYGINNSGQIVGESNNPTEGLSAFRYSAGSIVQLPNLGGMGVNNSSAAGINDSGLIAGLSYGWDGTAHAVLINGGTITDLKTSEYANLAMAINNSGQVAGYFWSAPLTQPRAFLYSGGSMTALGTLGGSSSSAEGMNDSGQVVGWSTTAGGADHAFLYSGGSMLDLGTLGGANSIAMQINNSGKVVGSSDSTAFLYSGGTMTNLNSVTDLSGSNFASLESANAINDLGQIVGYGLTSGGDLHAFLLTPADLSPVPEPSTLGTFGAMALLGLAARRVRRQRLERLQIHQPAQ